MLREKHALSTQSHRRQRIDLLVVTMYASLPMERQLEVFKKTPANTRKVVIATNIAETSITIDNIVYVVDSGFVKVHVTQFILIHLFLDKSLQSKDGYGVASRNSHLASISESESRKSRSCPAGKGVQALHGRLFP